MTKKNPIAYIITESSTTMYLEPAKIIKETSIVDGSGNTRKRVIAEGVLQTANEKNRNGRWYDSSELFPELESSRTLELLGKGEMRAEAGHPLEKDLVRQQTIDPKLTCAKFLKFWTEGMNVMGQFKGTYNALGEEFDLDIREGCCPAWSLRALGSIENTRNGVEVVNLKLITYDRVIYPSHPGAYTKGIVSESGILLPDGKIERPVSEQVDVCEPLTNESVIKYIMSESANFERIKETFDLIYDDIRLIDEGSKIQLMDKAGSVLLVNLETYISNEIMNYAASKLNKK